MAQIDHFANDFFHQAITYNYDIMMKLDSLQAYAISNRKIQYKKMGIPMFKWHFSIILVGIGKNNVYTCLYNCINTLKFIQPHVLALTL